MHGQFAWYELTTSDTKAAEKFYKTFTGWGSQPFDADYTLLTSNGVPVAGVFKLTDELSSQGVPPNWMPYIEVRNVDDSAKLAASLGAKIMFGPTQIPNVGSLAIVQDPQGAAFGIYKSASGDPSWDGTPVVGRFSWNELMTSDHVKAFDFYKRLFGWDKTSEMDMGGGAMYWLFGKGKTPYGGVFTRPPEMSNMPPFWLCYIHVNDVARALSVATNNGAAVHRPPMDIPDGVIAILGDPQGAGFALHHLNAAPVAKAGKAKKPATKKQVKKVTKAAKKVAKKASRKAVARTAAKKRSAAKRKVKASGSRPKKKVARKSAKSPRGSSARRAKKK